MKDAARIAGVKVNTAKSMMRVRRDEGRVDKKTVFGRPQKIIGEEESNLIVETLSERPDANADDLKRALSEEHEIDVSGSTIYRHLK